MARTELMLNRYAKCLFPKLYMYFNYLYCKIEIYIFNLVGLNQVSYSRKRQKLTRMTMEVFGLIYNTTKS